MIPHYWATLSRRKRAMLDFEATFPMNPGYHGAAKRLIERGISLYRFRYPREEDFEISQIFGPIKGIAKHLEGYPLLLMAQATLETLTLYPRIPGKSTYKPAGQEAWDALYAVCLMRQPVLRGGVTIQKCKRRQCAPVRGKYRFGSLKVGEYMDIPYALDVPRKKFEAEVKKQRLRAQRQLGVELYQRSQLDSIWVWRLL